MAATITYLGTLLNGADSTTNWSGTATPTLDTTSKIHGSGCLGIKQATGINYMMYNHAGGVDFTTGDKHFYIWGLAAVSAKLDSIANGGIRIRVSSSSATTNYYEWYVDGSDTYTGGWKKFVIDVNADPDATSGTAPTLSSITYLGIIYNCLSQFTGNNLTVFVDAVHIGTGLQITGTSTTDAGFEDMWTDETTSSNRYGIINKISGVYFIKGELVFGSTASATNPNFTDSNSTAVFEDQRTSSTLYKVNLLGNASDSTNAFQLGTAIGSEASTIGSKGVTIAATGSATSTGSYTYNNASPATITRGSGSFKTDGLKGGMFLQITGTSSNNKNVIVQTVAALTVTLISGETLTAEGPVSSTLTGSKRWDFAAADANIKTLKMYGSTFKQAGTVKFGSSSTALAATTLELVDNIFSNTRQITRNVTTSSPLYIRNAVNFNSNLTASKDIYDAVSTATTQWKILQGTGFQSTASGTQTLTLSNHDFTIATTPYITLETNETWDVINPGWTITNQTQLNFGGSTLSGATVNEKYSLSLTVQNSAGTVFQGARTYIYEGQINQNLPADNKQTTDSNGAASSNILKNAYVGAAASALTTTTYGQFAQRIYYYGNSPYIASLTVTSVITQTITLVSDSAVTQASAATAVTTGAGTVVTQTTGKRLLLFSYDGGTTIFTAGQTITGATSGHTGTVVEVSGTATSGKIIIRPTTQADTFNENETVNGSGGTPGVATLDKTTTNDSFTWEVACASLSVQNIYNYLAAHMAGRRNPIAYQYDASPSGFVDYSTAAKDLTTDDVLLMPTTPASGDIFYFGDSTTRFEKITINLTTAATTSSITWAYSDGASGWTNLSGVSDGTSSFTATPGTYDVTYTMPSGTLWGQNTVNGTAAYWIKATLSGSPSGQPKAATVWLDQIYESVHTWGTSNQGQLLYSGATGFYTSNAQIAKLAVDSADATTGWSAGTDSAQALDTTRFKEGSGALDLTKTGTSGTTASTSKTTTSRDFTSAFFGAWVRISSSLLANLNSSTAVTIRFGSDSSNYYVKSYAASVFTAGWNYITFNKYNATSTTGTPVDATCAYTYVSFQVTSAGTTSSVGDFVFDDIATFTGNSQGVYLSTRGTGTIDHFTADFGATFTPAASVTLSITVVNASNAPVETAQCAIYKVSDDTELMNEDTETVTTGSFVVGVKYTIVNVGDTDFTLIGAASNTVGVAFTATGAGGGTTGTATNGTATQTYTYLANTDIYFRIRKSSTGTTKYIPASSTGTITSSGFSTTVTLRVDSNA